MAFFFLLVLPSPFKFTFPSWNMKWEEARTMLTCLSCTLHSLHFQIQFGWNWEIFTFWVQILGGKKFVDLIEVASASLSLTAPELMPVLTFPAAAAANRGRRRTIRRQEQEALWWRRNAQDQVTKYLSNIFTFFKMSRKGYPHPSL